MTQREENMKETKIGKVFIDLGKKKKPIFLPHATVTFVYVNGSGKNVSFKRR
jgi:hypothetical protein